MIWYSIRLGRNIPFKIYRNAVIHIDSTCKLSLNGRLVVGSQRDLPTVSVLPINLYFGKNSEIKIGHSISIGQGVNIIVKNDGKLFIGNSTYFTSDMHIEVMNSVFIGNDCAISWGTTIIDDDHHEMIGSKTVQDPSVVIGDHVWIGCNTTILKGTRIGSNCIIGANSLVKGVFPDNCLIAGNPARIVKNSVSWK